MLRGLRNAVATKSASRISPSFLHRARKGLGATYAKPGMRPALHWDGEVRERGNSPSIYRFGFNLNLRLEVGGTYRRDVSVS